MKKLITILSFLLLLATVARCQSIELGYNLVGTVNHLEEARQRMDYTYAPSIAFTIPIRKDFNARLGYVFIGGLDAYTVGMEAQADWFTAGIELHIYNQGVNKHNFPNMLGGGAFTQAILRPSKASSPFVGALGGFDTKRLYYVLRAGLKYNIFVTDKPEKK